MPLSDSSETCMRVVRPEPSPAVLLLVGSRRLRGLPVLVHEASRRVWGLRLRRTEQELAISLPLMLPSANAKASASWLHLFGAPYPARLYPCLRFAVHLTVHNAKLGAECTGTARSPADARGSLSQGASRWHSFPGPALPFAHTGRVCGRRCDHSL